MFVVLAAGVLLGCGSDADQLGQIASREETLSGGVVEIGNVVRPEGREPPGWNAVEEMRLDRDSLGRPLFDYVRHVTVAQGDSLLYVLDTRQSAILVYTPGGDQLREIRVDRDLGVRSFFWSHSCELVVRDTAGLTVFENDGRHRWRKSLGHGSGVPPYLVTQTDKGLVEFDFLGVPSGERFLKRILVLHTAGDFEKTDTMPPIDLTVELVPGTSVPAPMNAKTLLAAHEDGSVWFARNTEYRIFQRSLVGDTLMVFSLADARPAKVSTEDKDLAARSWIPPTVIPLEYIPDYEPVLQRITTGTEPGRVYVFPRLEGVTSGTVIDVFDSGRYQGRIRLPLALETLHHAPLIAGDMIYGVLNDDYKTPRIVVTLRILGWDNLKTTDS